MFVGGDLALESLSCLSEMPQVFFDNLFLTDMEAAARGGGVVVTEGSVITCFFFDNIFIGVEAVSASPSTFSLPLLFKAPELFLRLSFLESWEFSFSLSFSLHFSMSLSFDASSDTRFLFFILSDWEPDINHGKREELPLEEDEKGSPEVLACLLVFGNFSADSAGAAEIEVEEKEKLGLKALVVREPTDKLASELDD